MTTHLLPNPYIIKEISPIFHFFFLFPAGKMATAIMTAINSPAHFFIQLPETSTFQHLSRLEDCMYYVYEKMQDRVPKVNDKVCHCFTE